MIDQTTVYAVSGGVAGATAALLLLARRLYPTEFDRLTAVCVVVPAVAAVGTALSVADVGQVTVAGATIDGPDLFADLVLYGALHAVAARLAGLSSKLFGLLVALAVANRLVFALASVTPAVAAGGIVVGFVATAGLYVGPVWRQAQAVSRQRRLLHWKGRNLLLFLQAAITVYAVLLVADVFPLDLVSTTAIEYIRGLLRVGLPIYLFVKIAQFRGADSRSSQAATTAD